MENKTPKVWPCNISPELLAAWQRVKRKKDPETMATQLKCSRPVIDRALLYGYVSIPGLIEKINTYFMDRLTKEKGQASKLMELADEIEKTN